MFGFGKSKIEAGHDIREMRERARRLKKGLPLDAGKDRLDAPPLLPIALGGYVFLVILFGATALAFRQHGLSLRIPLGPAVNDALFGAPDTTSIAGTFGDAAATAAAVYAASGFLSLVALTWVKLRDAAQVNLYLSFWGVMAGLPFTVMLAADFVWPLLRDVFDVLVGF